MFSKMDPLMCNFRMRGIKCVTFYHSNSLYLNFLCERKINLVLAEVLVANVVESPRKYNFYQTCKIKILLLSIKTPLHTLLFFYDDFFLNKAIKSMLQQCHSELLFIHAK